MRAFIKSMMVFGHHRLCCFINAAALFPNHLCRDENQRKAEGQHAFYMVGSVEPSPDHSLLAWSEDTTGNERYTLRVKVSVTSSPRMRCPRPASSGATPPLRLLPA